MWLVISGDQRSPYSNQLLEGSVFAFDLRQLMEAGPMEGYQGKLVPMEGPDFLLFAFHHLFLTFLCFHLRLSLNNGGSPRERTFGASLLILMASR